MIKKLFGGGLAWFLGDHGNWLGRRATNREYAIGVLGFALLVLAVLGAAAALHPGAPIAISSRYGIGVEVDLSPGKVATGAVCLALMALLTAAMQRLDGPRVERVRVSDRDTFDGPGYGWEGVTIELDDVLDVARLDLPTDDVARVTHREVWP
jgi:hypothetical protein